MVSLAGSVTSGDIPAVPAVILPCQCLEPLILFINGIPDVIARMEFICQEKQVNSVRLI